MLSKVDRFGQASVVAGKLLLKVLGVARAFDYSLLGEALISTTSGVLPEGMQTEVERLLHGHEGHL
jgi:hypothetical protein